MINKHRNDCTDEDKATMKNEVVIANKIRVRIELMQWWADIVSEWID